VSICRELGDDYLLSLARKSGLESVYARVCTAIEAGETGAALENDLDRLDTMVAKETGQGLYPTGTRTYSPLPGRSGGVGARWWTCLHDRCAGLGRVLPGQAPPTCGIFGRDLISEPLTR
jgi:hypothetical protein